jgi:hypothetical protein
LKPLHHGTGVEILGHAPTVPGEGLGGL